MVNSSIRYGGGGNDLRRKFLKFCGFLQGKDVVILDSDPRLCGEILGASDVKGSFIETLIATPAWAPILSIESVDGEIWKDLAKKFRTLLGEISWRDRIGPVVKKYTFEFKSSVRNDVDAEAISKLTLRILYELIFKVSISKDDENLFYQASLEWRKEIAMKGRGSPEIKKIFWKRLGEIFAHSRLSVLLSQETERDLWLSTIAQPFLISPQINISDIMVAIFHFLRADSRAMDLAKKWAFNNDKLRLNGIVFEAIRLKHPFPILERELDKGTQVSGVPLRRKTQFFLLFDRFRQDQEFNPERWLTAHVDNSYHSVPFGVGPRSCIGKPIAMEILAELLRVFLTEFQTEKIQPQIGHLYSGRDNDHDTGIMESVYQLGTIGKAIWRSWLMGYRQSKEIETAGCPWKKLQIRLYSKR